MRFRRFRFFCFRTCIRREFSTSTIILNNATIFESIFVMIARKHIQESDINNDVSLFIDKRQFRCQAMTMIFDIWIHSLSNNDDNFRCLNSFIVLSWIFARLQMRQKLIIFDSSFRQWQTKMKNILWHNDRLYVSSNQKRNIYRIRILIELSIWNAFDRTIDVKRIWSISMFILKSIRKYCKSN